MKSFFRRAVYFLASFAVFLLLAVIIWPEADEVPYEADAAYIAQAQDYKVPVLPADWRTAEYIAADGTPIHYGQSGDMNKAKATIVIVPGYTSAIGFYGDQYDMLTARSGRHRASHPQKMWVKDFSVYGNDIAGVLGEVGVIGDKKRPVILMGTSFGGAAATRALIDHDLNVAGALLLAPAYRPNTAPYSIKTTKRLVRAARLLGKGKRYGFGQGDWEPDGLDMTQPTECGSYPARLYTRDVMYMRDPSLRVGGVTSNWVGEIIENGEYVTHPDNAARLDGTPITMIAASEDVIIDSPFSETACTELFSECKLVIIPDTGHCLTLENDNVINTIYDEADALLER